MQREKVVITGGGLSGVLTALSLAAVKNGPEIILLEKDPEKLGRGVAYQHEFTHQPLNVVAGGMSLHADIPDDFVNWLSRNAFRYRHLVDRIEKTSFIPRKIFGDYVVERLKEMHDSNEGRFQIRIDEAISIIGSGNNRTVVLASGVTLQANHVILALGNFPPADVLPDQSLKEDHRYFSNPWTDKVYQNIQGNENILLIGTGLTAVDVVLGLHIRGFEGNITMLSRGGRLPLPHFISPEQYTWTGEYLLPPRQLFERIRRNIVENPQVPWTLIIDSLRPHVQKIWLHWNIEERTFFVKRLRPFWEIARHRIPQSSSAILEKLVQSGKLRTAKGNLLQAEGQEEGLFVRFNNGKGQESGLFQKIINCTGPESNYRKVKFPIIQDLMERGKVVPDALGLGISCDLNGKILNKNGEAEEGLWCIGPMRKAALWETTALREIREQAVALTNTIISRNKVKS